MAANSNDADGSLILSTELDNSGFEKGSAKLMASIERLSSQIDKLGAAMEKAFADPDALLRAVGSAAQEAAAVSEARARQALQSAESMQHAQSQVINANAQAEEEVTESQHKIISANAQAEDEILQSQTHIIAANEEAAAQIGKTQDQTVGSYTETAESMGLLNDGMSDSYTEMERTQAGMGRMVREQDKASASYEQASKAVKEYDKELAQIQKEIDQTEGSLSGYYREVEEIRATTNEVLRAMNPLQYPTRGQMDRAIADEREKEAAQIEALRTKYGVLIDKLEELKAEYERVAAARGKAVRTQEEAQAEESMWRPDTFVDIEELANSLRDRLAEIAEEAGDEFSEEMEEELEDIRVKAETLRQALEELGQVETTSDEYSELQYKLIGLNAELETLREEEERLENSDVDDDVWDEFLERELEVVDAIEAIEERMQELNESGASRVPGAETADYAQAAEALEQLEEAYTEMTEEPAEKTSRLAGVLALLTQGLMSASEAALSLSKRLARLALNAVSAGIRRAGSNLRAFQKKMDNTSLKTNALVKSLTSLKRLLITRVKRMFISSLFNQVKEGLKRLAKFDSEFNGHMNAIKNHATQLNGNVAVALGNLIAAVEPILTKLITALSTAVGYLNQFVALLQGKTTYTAAKVGTDDYAEAAEDAAKAQKEWNNELYSFDELNRQSKNDSDSSDTSGIQYETRDIDLPESVRDWVERLKAAWEAGDWYGVGLVIADGLNSAMKFVDNWINEKFRPWGVTWAGRIAKILNGIVDGLNWELVGKTLADGFNAILDIANTFLKEFNFLNLGVGFGRAVNSLVDSVDWHLLSETLANGFMGLINTAYGFLKTFDGLKLGGNIGQSIKDWFDQVDWGIVGQTFAMKWNALLSILAGIVTTPGFWESIGKSIGQFVKSWFTAIDLDTIATVIIGFFNGLTAMIRSFLDGNPFEGVAEKIYTAINRVVHEVDWAALGKAVSDLFMAVLKLIREVVDNVDWKGIGKAIGEFLGNIDWVGLFKQVAAIVWEAFTGVLSGLLSTDGGRIFLALVAGIQGLKLAFTATQAGMKAVVMRWVLTGINPLEGMPGMVGDIGTSVSGALTAMTDFFIDGLTNFEVAGHTLLTGTAATFATAALAVTDALLIAYDVDALTTAADTYHEAQEAYNHETEVALETFRRLYVEKGEEVAAEWAKTVYQIDTTGMSLDEAQKALVKQIDHYWDDTPKNMWDGFKQGWNAYFGADGKGLLSLLSDAFTRAINGLKSLLGIHSPSTVFSDIGKNVVSGFKDGFTSSWNTLVGTMSGFANSLISQIKSAFGIYSFSTVFSDIGRNLVTGLQNGFAGAWNGLVNTAVTYANNLISHIKAAFGVASPSTVFAGIGQYLDEGLEQGMLAGQKGLLRTATQIAGALTDTMDPGMGMDAGIAMTGMQAVVDGLSDIAVTFKAIADTLAAVGFLMPQIADGSVVPYKTRVDGGAAPIGGEEDAWAGLAAILSELQRIREQIQAGGGVQPLTIPITIDGREVFEAVVAENNRAIQRTGASPIRV